MTIGSNIRRIRMLHDLTQEEFGKIAGVSSMAVSQWENERAVPRMGAVQKISDALGVPKNDIIGDHVPDAIFPPDPRPAYAPLLGRVHAGDAQEPDILDAKISIPYEVWSRHKNAYFLQVEGDCMSKVYPEGSYILIDELQEPRNGSIAVVSIDDADYVMRRFYRGANTLILSPDSWNDEHEDIVITNGDDHTVELKGCVVWFQASAEIE